MYIIFYRNYLRCNRLNSRDGDRYVVFTGERSGTYVNDTEFIDKVDNMMDDVQLKERYPEYFV